MKNKDIVTEHYKRCTTSELLAIAAKPEELTSEALPLLLAELEQRQETAAAETLQQFIDKPELTVEERKKEDIIRMIQERVDAGDSPQQIRTYLKSEGVDIFSVPGGDADEDHVILDYMESLKEEGEKNEVIEDRLQSTFEVTKETTEALQARLRERGGRLQLAGYGMLFLLLLVLVYLGSGNSGMGLHALAMTLLCISLLINGTALVIKGHRLRR